MDTNRITRQSRSDDQNAQKSKGQSNNRSKISSNSGPTNNTALKKPKDTSNNDIYERAKRSQNNLHDGKDMNQMKQQNYDIHTQPPQNASQDQTPLESAGALTENSALYQGPAGMANQLNTGSQEAGLGVDRKSTNQMEVAHWTAGQGDGQVSNKNAHHLSNKSDTNINQSAISGKSGAHNAMNRIQGTTQYNNNRINFNNAENKKKRKNSDKAQRRESTNKRGNRADRFDKEDGRNQRPDGMIPPIDGNHSNSHPRSHSRGAAASTNSQGQNVQNGSKDSAQNPNVQQQQYFDQFNPFANGNQSNQNHGAFGIGMSGPHHQGAFPFGNHGTGPFMGGGNQAPQVHFIAKKQQFIAQISPEQLINGDKRPYTAQSLNNLSANAKRAGNVYANAMASTTKSSGINSTSYNLANAAFTNYPAVYLGGGARTHTHGFNFQPSVPGSNHKFSNSIYGEDVKPKIGGKDILQAMGASNGFSSGYNSDPYSSVMSQGLPTSLTGSTRPTKGKAQNRLHTKEKEQLYDETIKMKVLNNQLREDSVKLKTKIKILENELSRKEKTIEDLFGQNQIIQQQHQKVQPSMNQGLLPIAHTASKYQQETFLVMSLKKQIRELKYEVTKRDEELEVLRKNIKNTRTKEFEQEILTYHEECLRLRQMIEDMIKQGQSHPIHMQGYLERANQMQIELNQKDMIIKQLSESLNNQQSQGPAPLSTNDNSSFFGFKSQDNTKNDTNLPDVQVLQSDQSQTQVTRDKSVERKNQLGGAQGPKDTQKDLQRARKQLREKEKEMGKMRAEITQIRKENQEKMKNDILQTKDTEVHVKTLKERLKDSKNDMKRKEEKLAEYDGKMKRLEESLKSSLDQLRQQEESNKQLKNQNRALKQQKTQKVPDVKQDTKKPETKAEASPESKVEDIPSKQMKNKEETAIKLQPTKNIPKEELNLITLIGQREKLCRDDLTAMMLAGEESLKMLIKQPSDMLINFIKSNLENEDSLLLAIPRFEMPKTEFETQVLREMRIVLRENADKVAESSKEELMEWTQFEKFYNTLENFDYPHKDKLLEFIKYFFLDHIVSVDKLMMNYQAFKDHLFARRPIGASAEKGRTGSSIRGRRRSEDSPRSVGTGADTEGSVKKRLLGLGSDDEKHHEEERMLDVAEQCFMRIADLLHMQQRTVKQAFLKFAQPEQFKDGSILELMSPRGFLEGIREVGFDDVTEMEAACLMKVLAKPELENAVILNEFVLIMENFGIPAVTEEDEYENDYIPDSDAESQDKQEQDSKNEKSKDEREETGTEKTEQKSENEKKEEKDEKESDPRDGNEDIPGLGEGRSRVELSEKHKKMAELAKATKQKNQIVIKFDILDEKGSKILKKLARFLLQRYMHPREFFGPTIKKELIGKKKCKVEVIKLHDFYLRLKLASIRKKLKENISVNTFLAIDGDKFPGFIQVKRMIKALEIIAEGEQEVMLKEQQAKEAEEKDKLDQMARERAEQGLPELSQEELKELLRKEQGPDKEEEKKTESNDFAGKPPTGKAKNTLEEVMKFGGKSSPKGKDKEAKEPNRFASHAGPATQLNTIEEELHETQTSHYSYQVRDGEGSERDGSRHQLSTSNHLRGSHGLNELEDSSRRSVNSGAAKPTQPLGGSMGDYSGGSRSSKKKAKLIQKDIDSSNISIQDFKNGQHSERQAESEEIVPKEDKTEETERNTSREQNPESMYKATLDILNEKEEKDERDLMNEELDEAEQRMKDQLDAEVDIKLQRQMDSSHSHVQIEDDGEEYEENEFDDGADEDQQYDSRNSQDLKEDTIKTDKIEQMVEEDMKQNEMQIADQLNMMDEHVIMANNTYGDGQEQPIRPDDGEEYSYHDEETYSNQDFEHKQELPESEVEEDYEF